MAIFGAGASWDSVNPDVSQVGHLNDGKPPLAKDLFADRADFADYVAEWHEAGPLIQELRALKPDSGSTVESELQRFEEESTDDPRRRTQLAAIRYYLRDAIYNSTRKWSKRAQGLTNYQLLSDRIDRWRRGQPVVYVTFNYDTMLEDALDHRFVELSDYVDPDGLSVFKVHGSVDWGHPMPVSNKLMDVPVDENSAAHAVIRASADLNPQDVFARLPSPLVTRDPRTTNQFYVPALAIPLRNKSSFELPPEHLEALINVLPKIQQVLVVGWAAADPLLLQLMQSHAPSINTIIIVAGSTVLAAGTNLAFAKHGMNTGAHLSTGGFSELLTNDPDELLRGLLR